MVGAYRHSLAGRRDRKTRLLSAVSSFQGFLCKNFQFCLPEWPRSMSVRPNGGMQIVTTPSATHSDPWLSMQSQMHTQGAKTTPKQRSPGRATTRADDQSRFCPLRLRLYIRELAWITSLIGAGVSAFTTGDMWVLPSILVLLCVGQLAPVSGNSTLS